MLDQLARVDVAVRVVMVVEVSVVVVLVTKVGLVVMVVSRLTCVNEYRIRSTELLSSYRSKFENFRILIGPNAVQNTI